MDKNKISGIEKGTESLTDHLGPSSAEFIAIFSHELRDPLNCLRYSIHHLLNIRSTNDETVEIYKTMCRQIDHLAYLIDAIADCSWLDCRELTLKKELVEINDLISRALEMTRPIMEERHHQVEIENSANPIYLTADPHRLLQVLTNLLQNAAKYSSHDSKIRIGVCQEPDKLSISVKDKGIGIDGQLLPRIFDLFTRSDEARSLCRGAGIGLTLVQSLVGAHSGTVEARSHGKGHGSEFIVHLPC